MPPTLWSASWSTSPRCRPDRISSPKHGRPRFERGPQRGGRCVEDGEHAVSRRVDLSTAVPPESRPCHGEIPTDQPAETTVPEFRRDLGRADDVAEPDGGQAPAAITDRRSGHVCNHHPTSLSLWGQASPDGYAPGAGAVQDALRWASTARTRRCTSGWGGRSSFAKMLPTWVSIVFSVRNKCSAIAGLDRPSAIIASTSRSRGKSRSRDRKSTRLNSSHVAN